MVRVPRQRAAGAGRPQEDEIEDARWFTADNLPLLPSPMSIARSLIEDFLGRKTSPPRSPSPIAPPSTGRGGRKAKNS